MVPVALGRHAAVADRARFRLSLLSEGPDAMLRPGRSENPAGSLHCTGCAAELAGAVRLLWGPDRVIQHIDLGRETATVANAALMCTASGRSPRVIQPL
jgi:hypothetical protein